MRLHRYWLLPLSTLIAGPATAGGIAANVGIISNYYDPPQLIVAIGETVNFAAAGFHPLYWDADKSIVCTSNCNVTFLRAGQFGFYCANHGGPGGNGKVGMSGRITVVANPDNEPVFVGSFEHSLD